MEPNSGEILVYVAPVGNAQVEVRSVVTKHIRNVFKEGELDPQATCANFAPIGQAMFLDRFYPD